MVRRLARSALRSLGARYPFQRTARIVHNPLTRWATARLGQPEPVRCRNGLVVHVVPSDLIGRQLYLTGTWDPHLLLVLEALARGSEVIVDVGANVGFFALSMAAAAPTAAVHAVEPHPLLADLIERSVRASALPRVTIHRFALSESSGQATLAVVADHLGSSRVGVATAPGEATIPILLRQGDEFLEGLGGREIDLMKLDVEGHEAQVLRGMEAWLSKRRVHVILFEARGHGDDRAAADLLLRHGYRLLGVDKGLMWPRLCECSVPFHRSHEDVVAIAPDAPPRVRAASGGGASRRAPAGPAARRSARRAATMISPETIVAS